MEESIAGMRAEYSQPEFNESEVERDPFVQFRQWFDRAVAANLLHPNAMTLATATPDGRPSARIVLLKDFNEDGFVFYTNFHSRKGQELDQNPSASLVFWWPELERQVRIEGRVEKVANDEADGYFKTRPRGSQLAAWASEQSQRIDDRARLERRFSELAAKYQDREIPRPPNWGGYRLQPRSIEFWQGRSNRLHDRLRYVLSEDGDWQLERLAP